MENLLDVYLKKNQTNRYRISQKTNLKKGILAKMNCSTKEKLPFERWRIEYIKEIAKALDKQSFEVLKELEELQRK